MSTATPPPSIKIDLEASPRFRAELYPVNSSTNALRADAGSGEWRTTYEEAESDLLNMLVDVGSGYVGEIDKLYATNNTWATVDAE